MPKYGHRLDRPKLNNQDIHTTMCTEQLFDKPREQTRSNRLEPTGRKEKSMRFEKGPAPEVLMACESVYGMTRLEVDQQRAEEAQHRARLLRETAELHGQLMDIRDATLAANRRKPG
jgi:hypothetical protein